MEVLEQYRQDLLKDHLERCEKCGDTGWIEKEKCVCYPEVIRAQNKYLFVMGKPPLPTNLPVTRELLRMYSKQKWPVSRISGLQPQLISVGPGEGKTLAISCLYNEALLELPAKEILKISELKLFRILRDDTAYESHFADLGAPDYSWVMIDDAFHPLNWETRTGGDRILASHRNYTDWINTLYEAGVKMICAGEKPEVYLGESHADRSLLHKLNHLMGRV